jgi:molybdate transport system substrate-binding protein
MNRVHDQVRMLLNRLLCWMATSAILIGSSGISSSQNSSSQSNALTVFAASSLSDGFTEIGLAFDTKMSSKTVFQFAGSQTLKTQLENGAKADVIASANATQFDPLVKTGLVVGNAVFARNRLVVIVPKKGKEVIKTLKDLGKPGVKLVIADQNVPVGAYARDALRKLEALLGTGFATRALKNVVSEELNVRQVALKVQLGEADAGIVYSTDVTPKLELSVIQIAIPTRYNVIATYPIGTLKSSRNPVLAKAFVDFVRSNQGQAILKRWGFLGTP